MIAKRLGQISFAEAEEFVLDVRRQSVLNMGEAVGRSLVEEQLKLWEKRARPTKMKNTEARNGRTSNTGTAETD